MQSAHDLSRFAPCRHFRHPIHARTSSRGTSVHAQLRRARGPRSDARRNVRHRIVAMAPQGWQRQRRARVSHPPFHAPSVDGFLRIVRAGRQVAAIGPGEDDRPTIGGDRRIMIAWRRARRTTLRSFALKSANMLSAVRPVYVTRRSSSIARSRPRPHRTREASMDVVPVVAHGSSPARSPIDRKAADPPPSASCASPRPPRAAGHARPAKPLDPSPRRRTGRQAGLHALAIVAHHIASMVRSTVTVEPQAGMGACGRLWHMMRAVRGKAAASSEMRWLSSPQVVSCLPRGGEASPCRAEVTHYICSAALMCEARSRGLIKVS